MIEKRKFKRVALTTEIDYYSDIKGQAKNISESGLCMVIQSSLSKGIPLILKFDLSDEKYISTIGIIVRCRNMGQDNYECAVKFTSMNILDQQKIRKYVYDKIKENTDRRKDFRTDIDLCINCPSQTIIKNFNSQGLCIITNKLFEKDNIILLSFTMPEGEKLHVYSRVKWSKEAEPGTIETGIEFWNIDENVKSRLVSLFQDYKTEELKPKKEG